MVDRANINGIVFHTLFKDVVITKAPLQVVQTINLNRFCFYVLVSPRSTLLIFAVLSELLMLN